MGLSRLISPQVKRLATQYPVVTITGPRQSGKTTLCKKIFNKYKYFNLENIETRKYAETDPKAFLAECKNGAVIDEIQRCTNLLSDIQVEVDNNNKAGQFILTGSQNFELLASISQSLAGRTALVKLLPFSLKEIHKSANLTLDDYLYQGFYPRIYDKNLNATEAMSFYLSTYIERDLRSLINVKDLSQFEVFLKLCAGRSGQIVNFSSLGNDVGVKHSTIKSWLSILEASYIIKLLPPYYHNYGKRLIKSPKLYFLDTGLASFLMGIENAQQMKTHPLRGNLFETFVITELLKYRFNQVKNDNLYFFRDHKGNEIDVILDYGHQVDALEIKAGQTINPDFFKGLNYFSKLKSNIRNSYLVYGGKMNRSMNNAKIIKWRDVDKIQI